VAATRLPNLTQRPGSSHMFDPSFYQQERR
jgi:hypothetical protein